jgi:hypothetical protein
MEARTDETESLALLVWFQEPAEALSDPIRFVAYALARATHEDVNILCAFLTDDDLHEALDRAPPVIINPRSWAYRRSKATDSAGQCSIPTIVINSEQYEILASVSHQLSTAPTTRSIVARVQPSINIQYSNVVRFEIG